MNRLRISKQLDRRLGLLFWGSIGLVILWPFAIILIVYEAVVYVLKGWCFNCYKPFGMRKLKEDMHLTYWEKQCLDGTPDLRYKQNKKYERFRETCICKYCGVSKTKMKTRIKSY